MDYIIGTVIFMLVIFTAEYLSTKNEKKVQHK